MQFKENVLKIRPPLFLNYMCYLLRGAKDVSIVLAEPADPSQTSQGSRELIPMQRPKVRPSQRKFPPRANALLKHQTKDQKAASDSEEVSKVQDFAV